MAVQSYDWWRRTELNFTPFRKKDLKISDKVIKWYGPEYIVHKRTSRTGGIRVRLVDYIHVSILVVIL